jgi:hypothetical protein
MSNPLSGDTPEQLASKLDHLSRMKDVPDAVVQRVVGDIVEAAEAGGEEHMSAVAAVVAIVFPADEHDLRRCRDSHPHADGRIEVEERDTWPRCIFGLILTERPDPFSVIDPERITPTFPAGGGIRRDSIYGICPCRCHEHDVYGPTNRSLNTFHRVPEFSEDMLDANGKRR